MLSKYLEWFRHHERLVLVLAVGVMALLAWHKWVAHADQVDHDQAVIAREKVKTDAQLAQVQAQQTAQLQATVNTQAQQIATLQSQVISAINQRLQATSQRKEQEKTAPLPVLGQRWTELVNAPAGSITPMDTGLLATDAAARSTVQALEDGQTAEANLADLTRLDQGKDGQITTLNSLVESVKKTADAEKLVLQDQVTSCKADLKETKDKAAKAKRRSFLYGLGVGAGAVAAFIFHL